MLLRFSRNNCSCASSVQTDGDIAGMTFLHQDYMNLQKYFFCLLSPLYLCPGCAEPAFTQFRLHAAFPILSQNYLSTRFCRSQIQVCVLFQLNPALNPVWVSDLFNHPMFIWSMLLPSLKLLPKERVMISCDDYTAAVNEFLNNSCFHTDVSRHRKMREESKANKLQSIKIVPPFSKFCRSNFFYYYF